MLVDLQLRQNTAINKLVYLRKFLKGINKPVDALAVEDIRNYLGSLESKYIYAHTLRVLKRFLRDYLNRPELIGTFRFPHFDFKPKILPSKDAVQKFYNAIPSIKERALFLLLATSGLRRGEILSLTRSDIDWSKRMIIPNKASSATKRTWISFFNEEAETILKQYLELRKDRNPRLFPLAEKSRKRIFGEAVLKTGIYITPHILREWFCSEMGRLSVPDRYIDAFCGRVPRSVLARHYSDFSPERLKEIYDKAGLKVLA